MSPTTRADFLYARFHARPELVHRVEDAAVDGLEAVADVGQRAPDDDGHGVVQIGLPHFVFDRDRQLALVRHQALRAADASRPSRCAGLNVDGSRRPGRASR